MTKVVVFVTVVFQLLLLLQTGDAIWMKLPATGTKCVSEDIQNNVIVIANYVAIDDTHQLPPMSVKVTSPFGKILHQQENATHGKIAFTTAEAGNYMVCFSVSQGQEEYKGGGITVSLDWKIGIAAKDWDSFAKKEKLEGLELELKKLEEAVEAIHKNIVYLKDMEAEMRSESETTNSRVAWFSIMSFGTCIGVSAWNIWHLKTYFQKKKLI